MSCKAQAGIGIFSGGIGNEQSKLYMEIYDFTYAGVNGDSIAAILLYMPTLLPKFMYGSMVPEAGAITVACENTPPVVF